MQRRKISNLILDPKSLARLSIPFILLASVSIGTVLLIQWKVLQALKETTLTGAENLETMNTLLQMQSFVTTAGAIGIMVFCVCFLVLWIIFSHRIFGPMIPIRRHVQRLTAGEFSSRVQVRPGDHFEDLVNDLNRLAEALEKPKN